MSARGRAGAGAVAAIAVAVVASGCGARSTAGPTQGVAGTTATISPVEQEAQVKQVWTSFFNGSTPATQKVLLLQNGKRFGRVVVAAESSPLAKHVRATVSSVQLHGTSATVVYSLSLNGKVILARRHGTAVLVGRAWKVGDKSFCELVGLQGSAPAVCRSSGG